MPAYAVFIPATVLPAFVIAAIDTPTSSGQCFFGKNYAVGGSVCNVSQSSFGSSSSPHDGSAATRCVTLIHVRAFVADGSQSQRRCGNISCALDWFPLKKTGTSSVVISRESGGAVAGQIATSRAVEGRNHGLSDRIFIAVVIDGGPERGIIRPLAEHIVLFQVWQHFEEVIPAVLIGCSAAGGAAVGWWNFRVVVASRIGVPASVDCLWMTIEGTYVPGNPIDVAYALAVTVRGGLHPSPSEWAAIQSTFAHTWVFQPSLLLDYDKDTGQFFAIGDRKVAANESTWLRIAASGVLSDWCTADVIAMAIGPLVYRACRPTAA